MRTLRALVLRLRGLFDRSRFERELADEIDAHLEMHVDDNIRAGMAPDEALRVARARLGGVEATKQECRDRRGFPGLESLFHDLRYGVRTLRRDLGFTVVAVLTIAVGIGATTAIFSVVYATLLAPLPYPNAHEVVIVWTTNASGERRMTSPYDYTEWKRRATSFAALEAWSGGNFNLLGSGTPEQVGGDRMTPGFLPMLGERPQLGRYFLPEEGEPGNDKVVILTNRLWQRRFGGDPGIIGREIRIDEGSYTVVGVRPAGLPDRVASQLTIPLAFTPDDLEGTGGRLMVMGRLEPGATLAQARSEMGGVVAALDEERPANEPRASSVESLQNNFLPDETRTRLWLLMGAVAFVLLIACANVANLMLARGTVRQRELAVRMSIGASPSRLFRQLLTESLALAALGAALGVGLSWALLQAILAIMPPFTLPAEAEVALNIPVLLFTLGAAVLAGLLFGCAPAVQAAHLDVNERLKDGGRSGIGSGRQRLRRALVVTEFALALALVAGAALVVHSIWNLSRADLGVRAERVLTFTLPVRGGRFSTPDEITPFYDRIVEGIQAVPGVERATASTGLPLVDYGFGLNFSVAGRPANPLVDAPETGYMQVTPGFFDTYGVEVSRGRAFTDADRAGSLRVAMVSEGFARRYLDDADPVGQRLLLPTVDMRADAPGPMIEWLVVGVFDDIRYGGPRSEAPPPQVLVPFHQSPWPRVSIAVRTSGDPAALGPAVAAVVASMDPELPLADVKTLEQRVESFRSGDSFGAALLASFAGVALLLAAFGIYGVMAYSVTQHAHEIGIRVALGARGADVLRLVLGQGVKLTAIGVLAGLPAAIALSRLMESLLFGVSATDPATFVGVPLLLTLVALLACWIPARRATKVDPMIALRND